ncbi:MAG: Ig-like domain repeat protein, partial [Methanobacteriaceae archaeon]|nr:Ig-like domain repeat protein [Methanobacteriaceae archaeon]
MKKNIKFLLVLAILFTACLCVGSTFAADVSGADIAVNDVNHVDNTMNIEIAHDDSSQKDVEINSLNADNVGNFTELKNYLSGKTGTITLNKSYVYNADDNLVTGITINNNNVVIDGNGFTIDGSGLARAFEITGSNVTLKNINFINCNVSSSNGGAVYWNAVNGTLSACTFTSCFSSSKSGGAVYWNAVNGTLSACTFTSCSTPSKEGGAVYWYASNGVVSDCNFTDCSASTNGGAVYWAAGNGTLSDCTFTSCSASNGGAVYWNGANSAVSDCNFTNCFANGTSSSSGGGAVYWYSANGTLSDCNFTNCNVPSKEGGAVYWNGLNGVVSACIFTNCNASDNNGGAVQWTSNAHNGTLSDCNFTDCFAKAGGAINWNSGNNGTVIGCIFTNCNASVSNGGAINWASVNGVVSACIFTNCFATQKGGAVYWNTGNNGTLSDCIFTDCSSTTDCGGAIYWQGANGTLSGCNFTDCNATNYGGAVCWFAANGTLSDCIFTDCNATRGTAIYIGAAGKSLAIINFTCTPIDSKAPIYNLGTILSGVVITTMNGADKEINPGDSVNLTATMTISGIAVAGGNLNFTVNGVDYAATTDDYGLYFKAITPAFKGTQAVNAKYLNAEGNQIVNTYNLIVGSDGGLYVAANGSDTNNNGSKDSPFATIEHALDVCSDNDKIYIMGELNITKKVTVNKTVTIEGIDATINGKKSETVFEVSADNVTIKNINFIDCYHDDVDGGAVYWLGANGALSDCIFTNCFTYHNAGAVCWTGVNGTLSDCIFTNCSADSGGAVYWYGVNGTLSDCIFTNCHAVKAGAICWSHNFGVVKDCVFTNCFASGSDAGAIWLDGVTMTTVIGCNFTNCSANKDVGNGGAIWCDSWNIVVKDCIFTGCSAKNGGAIRFSDTNCVVNGSIFTNCSAIVYGDAIYIGSGKSLTIINSTCTPIDSKAPLYNDGTILSDVVITTMNGADKEITSGDSVNLTATMTAGGIAVAGGKIKFTVKGVEYNATSDKDGLYSTEITPAFEGTEAVNATYLNANGAQNVNAYNLIVNAFDYNSFTQLAADIAACEGNTLVLNHSYQYYDGLDDEYKTSIHITKSNFTIDGNGYTIDAKSLARVFYIENNSVTIKNINFINCNITSGSAGAIFWIGENGTVSDCNFTNCYASSTGGAIRWNAENGVLSGCIFTDCSAYKDGGAVYWAGENGVVSDCIFTDCSVSYNNGGAVFWQGNYGDLSDCNFTNCYADTYASAVYWSGADSNMSACIFTDCSAKDGGAVYWSANNGNVSDCNFTNCSATNGGGAIHWHGKYSDLSACIFTDCSATEGGAVYWSAANGTLSDCIFTDCSATKGGAIRGHDCDNIALSDCIFTNCYASSTGGAIYWSNGADNCVVSACTFITCNATNGTAIYMDWGSLNISNSTCTPIDAKAPIYNKDTILSDVVITTMNGTDKEITSGDSVNLTATMTTSGMLVASGKIKFTVKGVEYNATSDEYGLYSVEITPAFIGTEAITANYINGKGNQTVNACNLTVLPKPDTNVVISNISDIYVGSNATITANVANDTARGTLVFIIDGEEKYVANYTGSAITYNATGLAVGSHNVTVKFVNSTDFKDCEANATFNVLEKVTPSLVFDNDTTNYSYFEGYSVTVTVTVPDDLTGYLYFSVDNGEWSSFKIRTNHKATYNIATRVVGEHTITVKYNDTNAKYNSNENSTTFTVKPYNVNINVSDAIRPVFTLEINKTDGDWIGYSDSLHGVAFTIQIDNGTTSDKINLTEYPLNGSYTYKGTYTVPSDLIPGEHNATITFYALSTFKGEYELLLTTKVVNFNISKICSNVSVTNITGTIYGETLVVTAKVNDTRATGEVTFVIGDKNATSPVNASGYATATFNGLNAGNYNVIVTYSGDENFTNASANKEFNIAKVNLNSFNITVSDEFVTPDESLTITASTNPATSGNVTLFINGVANETKELNGSGEIDFTIAGLTPGDYTFFLEYGGNGNYLAMNSTNRTVRFGKYDPNMTVSVNSTIVDDKANVSVKLSGENATPTGNVLFIIGNTTLIGYLDNGSANVTFTGLAKGQYTVLVNYNGDGLYNTVEANKTFNIVRYASNANVSVDAFTRYVDGKTVVYVTVNDSNAKLHSNVAPTGIVQVTLGGETKNITLTPGVRGRSTGTTTFDGFLANGTYTVTAKYLGDNHFDPSNDTATIRVFKHIASLDVTAKDITYGDVLVVTAKVNNAATGNISFTINGVTISGEIRNGTATVTFTGLAAGNNYRVYANYIGDEKFTGASDNDWFNVRKATPSMNVTVTDNNITVFENTTVEVKVFDDGEAVSGKVSFSLNNGRTWIDSKDLVNGSTSLDFTNYPAGTYNVLVRFNGNDNYTNISKKVSFTVNKVNPTMNIDVDDIDYRENETITVSLPKDAEGTVTFYLNGAKIGTVKVNKGSASITVPGLEAGNYSVEAVYSGDRNYNSYNVSNGFVVKQIMPEMSISTKDISYRENETIKVSLPKDAEGTVTFYLNGTEIGTVKVNKGSASITVPG